MENNKKKLQIPSTCALLFMLMIVCAILTWIVPAGEFDTEKVGNLNKVPLRFLKRQERSTLPSENWLPSRT